MNVEARLRRSFEVTLDREAVVLAVLLLVVLVPSVLVAVYAPMDMEPTTYGMEGATLGGAWVIAEVIFAALLVGLIYLLRYLPEWIRSWARIMVGIVLAMLLGAGGAVTGGGAFWFIAGAIAAVTFIISALDEYDLWWMANDLLAVAVAIWLAAAAGPAFGIEAMVIALVGLSIYDWYFADRNKWMFALGGAMMKLYLPILFIIPNRLRIDWDDLTQEKEDLPDGIEEAETPPDDPEELGISMGIGTADLALPAMFATAVATTPSALSINGVPAAVVGIAVGVAAAAFRIRWKVLEHDGGAGMPPLTTGALAGWAPFAAIAWVVTLV